MSDPLHPPHDAVPARPLPTTVLAEWDPGTFLENLAPTPDGGWWVTSPNRRRVDEVAHDGGIRRSIEFPGQVTGIVADPLSEGSTLVSCGDADTNTWTLFRISGAAAAPVCGLPGIAFANGMTWYRDRLVIADSTRGALMMVDPASRQAQVMRTEQLLAPLDATGLPGVNGLAVDASGDLLLTNTSRSQLLRLHGEVADGELTVIAERLVGDDLAAHPDGSVYIATHTYHSVLRLTPDGQRCDVATHEQGVEGPTSVAVSADGRSLVTCTTGGLLSPVGDAPGPARLVRIDLTASSATG